MTPDRKTETPELLKKFARDQRAATSVEYALIGVTMAIMLLAALAPIRTQLVSVFALVASAIQAILAG